jgi:hypothetical protein
MCYVKTAKALMIVLSLASLMFVFPLQAMACSCVGPRGKAAVKASLVAFRGTVTKIDYLDPDTAQSEPRIIVTFLVSRVWKGLVRREIVLHTIYNKYSCAGFYFQKGKEYLVFAYPTEDHMAKRFSPAKNTLGTNICTGTNLIESAQDDLREIGKGRKPG